MPKHCLLISFFLAYAIAGLAQTGITPQNVVITSRQEKTAVRINEKGELQVNVSPKDVQQFKANGMIHRLGSVPFM